MVRLTGSFSKWVNFGNTALVLRIVLSSIFILAGTGKLVQGNQFFLLAGYQFLPQSLVYPLDLILPWAELTLGILLLTGYYLKFTRYISIIFILTFIGANSYYLLSGSQVPCDCFGGMLRLTHGQSLILDIVMLMLSLILIASGSKSSPYKPSLRIRQGRFFISRAILLIIFLIVFALPANLYAATPDNVPSDTYATMKFSRDQLVKRDAAFKSTTGVSLDPGFKAMATAVPASFSLLQHLQYTPSQRNQGSVGNCWVWAGTGLMEVALDVNNSIKNRLSIQYFDSNYSNRWAGCGGWLGELVSFYNNPATDTAIPWSNYNANYQDASRSGCPNTASVPASSIVATPSYATTNNIQVATVPTIGVGSAAIANIQAALLQNKAVEFDYMLPTSADWNSFFSFWSGQPDTAIWTPKSSWSNADSGEAGHAVVCVGYDQTDPLNPYWIMLNSWGTTSGRPSGLFRVSMNMNYDSHYNSYGFSEQSFYWSTINNVFAASVAPAPASKLAFTTQPSAINTVGIAFGTQPVVTVQDASGNTVTTSNAPVTLTITGGTGAGGAVLSGTATVNALNGIAAFNGLNINLAGTGYTLTAANTSLTSAVSSSFSVNPVKLAFTTQPGASNTAGAAFGTQPVVTVQDAVGNTMTASTAPVTLTITTGTGTSGAVLSGTATINAVTGIASFSGLNINLAGTGYTLTAASTGLTSAVSSSFNVNPVPVASKLVFTTQPSASNTVGTAFWTQPLVKVQDASSNTMTTSTALVSLTITTGTGTSGAVLSGTATVNAVNGIASFSGLNINLAGTGYTLTAASTGLTSAVSSSFDVNSANYYYVASFNMISGLNSYAYYDMNGVTNYTIQSGDYLQYDILWNSTTDLVGLDYTCTDGSNLRDSGSLDQNGLNAHPKVDISSRSYNTWYSRKIALPAGQVGKTISYYDIVCEWDGAATKTSSIKNIRITDAGNSVRKMILAGNEASVTTTPHYLNQGSLVSFVRNAVPVATKLAFTTQPGASNTAGTPFATQPVVTVQDASGNTMTTSVAPVTLTITGGTGASGAVLSGTATVNAVNGIAAFTGLNINLAGTGYTLTAASTGLTSAVSSSFNVNPVPVASKLAFTTQPGASNTVGTAFATQPVVTVQDSSGTTMTTSTVLVTLTITGGTGAGGAVLSGTATVNAVNGIAAFTGLNINLAGIGYTLTAASTGLTSAVSTSFNVNSVPVATKLAFTTQPGASNTAGTPFATQPVVKVQDSSGTTMTTSTALVTLTITGGTGANGAVLSGTTTANAVNGIAAFNGLNINLAGTGYTLTAASTGLTSAVSSSFDVNSANYYYVASFNMISGLNSYAYYDMNGVTNYTIQSGDYLQYDILWNSTTDLVGLDYTCTDGSNLRDSGSLDQNGLNAHPKVDISSRSYNTWYSRKIALPAGQVGKTISYYDIVCEWDGAATKTSSIKNIRITDAGNSVRKMILAGNEASVTTTPHYLNQGSLVSFVRNAVPVATKLAFTTQPGASNTAGTPFATQPVVTVQDASGNTMTTSVAPVTLTITGGTGASGAVLSGTATVNAVNGIAAFTGLNINLAGTGYTLTAASTGLTSAVSSSFNVNPVPVASKLAFTTQPGASNTVGTAFATQPVVTVQDSSGTTMTTSTVLVTLTITGGTGAGGAVLSGTATVNAVNGIAAFTGLNINLAGIGYTLTAASTGLTSAVSTSFNVNSVPVATKLAFTTQPGASNTAGTPFATQPVVKVQDSSGTTMTTSTALVTLTITGGTGANGAVLSGTTTANAVNGIAAFNGLNINLAGTGYTLTAASTGLTSAVSSSFDVNSANYYYVASFNMISGLNSYAYYDMNGVTNYTIQSGDYLQYDILWNSTTDLVGLDYTCTDGSNLRDSGSLDQNGLNAHPKVDISSRSYNTWYSRKIALPAGQVGKTISYYDIVCEWDGAATKTSSIKNIRITDAGNSVRKMILAGNEASVTTTPHYLNQGSLVSFVRN